VNRFRALAVAVLVSALAAVGLIAASPAGATTYTLSNVSGRTMTVSELYGGLTSLPSGRRLTDAGGSWKIARGDWCRWHVVNGTSRYTPANGGYDVWVNYGNEVIDACGRI
jgi:hypothetical protein